MSTWLCPVERLPSGLHTYGVFAAISAPFRSGSSVPHYMCKWARRLSRVKLAVICGARSALRRWSCSNCERRCERTHCVREYNGIFTIHVHGETNFTFPTLETRRGSRDGCLWLAKDEEDRRASHNRRQTSWNLAKGGKVVRAGHRLCGGVGGWYGHRGGLLMRRAHRRAPAWLQNDTRSGRKYV